MRTRTTIGLFFVCAAAIGTVAYKMYESRSVPRALPVLVPFAIDAEGKSITIPFDVRQGEVDLERGFMIALDVPNGPDLPAVDDVRVNSRSMRVKVFYEDRGVRIPVQTEDVKTIYARNNGKPQPPPSDPSICRLHLYSTLDDESHIAVCGFYARRYGHYVAEVSTIESLPAFKGIVTTMLVDEFFNNGN